VFSVLFCFFPGTLRARGMNKETVVLKYEEDIKIKRLNGKQQIE
jgi:hypothetical protein